MKFTSMHSLEEALATLAELGDSACVLAGGTDVMVQLNRGELSPEVLVHIEPLAELAAVSCDDHLVIGATTTTATLVGLATSSSLLDGYGSVSSASAQVGGWQTQSVATVGGNIANASPAADLCPPLLVHGAQVSVANAAGSRSMPLTQFITGRRSTALAAGELITSLQLDPVGPDTADAFVKVGRRSAMEVSIVALAVRLTLSPDLASVVDVRVAVGSCGPMAFRASEAEAVLLAGGLTTAAIREAGQAVVGRAQLIDDVRATASYRQQLLPRVLAKAIAQCRQTIVSRSEVAA